MLATTGARLNPINITTAPVTTGGSTECSTRGPATWMSTPTAASTAPATRIAPVTSDRGALLRVDRQRSADEGGAGAQVAGHLSLDDQKERDRGDAAHHDRTLRVEAHDDREDESCAEHGDYVLRPETDGPAPGQPLVGRNGGAGRWCPSAVNDLPGKHRHPGLLPTGTALAKRCNPSGPFRESHVSTLHQTAFGRWHARGT